MILETTEQSIYDFYDIDEAVIGSGGFGSVRKARLRSGGPSRVVKSVSKRNLRAEEFVHKEIEILKKVDHPSICRLYETFEDDKKVELVLEFIDGRELFDVIIEHKDLDEAYGASIMAQIFGALQYCHKISWDGCCVVHRDLKPENIMLQRPPGDPTGPESVVKLIDFGLAVMCAPGHRDDLVGTNDYIAPETLAKGSYGPASDLWSIGVILHCLLLGTLPSHEVRSGAAPLDPEAAPWTKRGVSYAARDLVSGLLKLRPQERTTADEAAQHTWIVQRNTDKGLRESTKEGVMSSFVRFHQSQMLIRAAKTAAAMQWSSEQFHSLREQFLLIDSDHNGRISKVELVKALEGSADSAPGSMDVLSWAEEVYDSVDSDGSGEIEYSEWLAAAMSDKDLRCEQVARAAFRVFDVDGNGRITRHELHSLVAISENETGQLFQEFDVDGDGEISFEEFRGMLNKKESANAAGSQVQPTNGGYPKASNGKTNQPPRAPVASRLQLQEASQGQEAKGELLELCERERRAPVLQRHR